MAEVHVNSNGEIVEGRAVIDGYVAEGHRTQPAYYQGISGTVDSNGNLSVKVKGLRPEIITPERAITDNTLIKINGLEMPAKVAASHGYLRREPDGTYTDKEVDLQVFPQEKVETEVPSMDIDLYNPELSFPHLETSLEVAAMELGGGEVPDYEALDRHAVSAFVGLAKGDISGAAKNLAVATGAEPEEAQNFIQKVSEGFQKQAEAYISKTHKVDGKAVCEWARDNLHSSKLTHIFHQVYLGRSGVLDQLAHQYKIDQNRRRNTK